MIILCCKTKVACCKRQFIDSNILPSNAQLGSKKKLLFLRLLGTQAHDQIILVKYEERN